MALKSKLPGEQDNALIAWLNSGPNRATYQFVSRNCADFVREVLDFYYPRSVARGSIPDLFVSTPKHAANSLARYGKRHPDLEFTEFVIPQVPSSVKRSRPVRGVLESLFRAKKYVVALAVFHPLLAGGAVSADLIGDRFNSARNSRVFSLTGEPLAPPTNAERRAFRKDLQTMTTHAADRDAVASETAWRKFVEKSEPKLDADGQAVLQAPEGPDGKETVELGVTRRGLQSDSAPVELQRELLVSRLKQTLANSRAPRISRNELRDDWRLLEKIDDAEQEKLSRKLDPGNQAAIQKPDRSSE